MVIMETTKKVKNASEKIDEAISLIEDAMECIRELESEGYSERRGSMRMKGRYGRPSYRHDDDYEDELPRYRRY